MHYEGLWERAGCGETWRGVHWRGPRLWVLSGSQCPCSADLALPIPLCRAVCAQHSRISAQDATHTAASRIFVPSPAIDAIGSADSARAIRHNEQPPSAADRLRPDSTPRILPAQTPKARLTSPRLTHFGPIRLCMPLVQQTSRGRFGTMSNLRPPPTGSGTTAHRASFPHKHQRRGSPRRALRVSSLSGNVCHWFSRPRAGDSA